MCVRECVLVCTGARKCTCMHVSVKAYWIDTCYVRGKIQAEKKKTETNRENKEERLKGRHRRQRKEQAAVWAHWFIQCRI